MTPDILDISGLGYALQIVILACLVVSGVYYLFKLLYGIRDYLRKVVADDDNPLLLRILAMPIWLAFAIVCLIFTAIGWLFFLLALRDFRDWWHKDEK